MNWGAEVAAIDKTLTALLGTETPATGTSGTTPAPGNKASAAVTLDEASRAKLTEFRTHITAFAVAMSGQQPPAADAAAPASAAPTSDPAQPPATTQPPAAAPPATAQPPATEPPAAAQTPAAPAVQVDEDATRRHLTGARNALSELTQLPAASQLTGDARTQVSQLITNFNELISTKTEWRGAYAKVAANLMALLGPDTGTPDPSSGSGTPGAVGTSGAGMNLDAGIRGKLVEMRRQLAEFEKAAGGTGGAAPTAAEAQPPAAPGSSPTPAAPAASPTPAAPAASPTPAAPAATPAPSASPSAPDSAQSPAGDALAHLAAIESLMKMQNEGGGVTFDKAQVELLRTHLAELRRILEKK